MGAKVGNLQVVHTQSLILPDGQDGWAGFTLGTWEVKLRIQFLSDQTPTQQLISFGAEGDEAWMRLTNWTNPLGTATTTPVQFATADTGASVYVMVAHWRIGSVNRLDVQFLLEAK